MESGKIWYNSSKLLLDVSNYMATLFLINNSQKAERTIGECKKIDYFDIRAKMPWKKLPNIVNGVIEY